MDTSDKFKQSFLAFVIETLLITNIWIFLYNNILFLLNLHNTQTLPPIFFFPLAVPEPYEIPLYLVLTFFTVAILFILHKFLIDKREKSEGYHVSKYWIIAKYTAFVLLLILFITNIGKYPMKNDYTPYPIQEDKNIYSLAFTFFTATVATIIIQISIFGKILKKYKNSFQTISLLLILIIGFITFEAKFPISAHDYSFFYGPIWETVHGKTLYTQSASQYGFLIILFFSILYKLRVLNLIYLPVFFWILFIIEYYLIFYLVYKVSKSYLLSSLAIFSVITVTYFSLSFIPIELPQGPTRWLPLILALFFFSLFKRADSKKLIFLLALIVLLVVDSGISIILGYVSTISLLVMTKNISFKKGLISIFFLFLNIMLIFLIINVTHVFLRYQPIEWSYVFTKLQQYAKFGFTMLPIDLKSYFWFVPLIYFATLLYILKKKDSINPEENLLLFTAHLSLFGGIYYVGRSHPHNIFSVVFITILNLFIFISFLIRKVNSSKLKIAVFLLLFLATIVFPAYNRRQVMTEILTSKYNRMVSGSVFSPLLEIYLKNNYSKEKNFIKKNIKDNQIVILHADDTYLLYLSNKKNLINTNPQAAIITYSDADFALQKVFQLCPKKIVVDCRLVNRCSITDYKTLNEVSLYVQPYLLNRIQSVCKVKYEPIDCTSKLCIAQAN